MLSPQEGHHARNQQTRSRKSSSCATSSTSGQTKIGCAPASTNGASRSAHTSAGLRRGRPRLASIPTANATLVPQAIERFSQRHPDVDLTMVDDHQQGLLARLARWELDLALIYDHESLPEPEMRLERTSLRRRRVPGETPRLKKGGSRVPRGLPGS
jgi:DNA-binding transcriptional LysR family regulator